MTRQATRAQRAQEPQDAPGRGAEPHEGAGGHWGALRLVLPLPDPLLTPNLILYWRKKAEHVARHRGDASLVGLAKCLELGEVFSPPLWPTQRVRMDVDVHPRPRMKAHDDDNFWAALKATRDGLADAGIVADDKQFRQGELTWTKEKRTGELIITLTQEEG